MSTSESGSAGVNELPSLYERNKDAYFLALAALLGFMLLICFSGLSSVVMGDHECINALAARYTLQTGEWLIPQLGDQIRIRKTPLGIWLIAASAWLLDSPHGQPVTEFSARFPSALAGLIQVFLVCWMGTMMFGRRTGLVAGFITAASVFTIFYSRTAQVDMILAMLTTLSLALFYRGLAAGPASPVHIVGFGIALAAAMMAKAPLPLVIVGLAITVYWFAAAPMLKREGEPSSYLRQVKAQTDILWQQKLWIALSVLLFVILSAAWPLYVYLKVPEAQTLWRIEYFDRFSGDLNARSSPAWYYIPLIFGLMAPYLFSVPEALLAAFLPRYRAHRQGLFYALAWALTATLFLSMASYKRPHYLLSAMPAYALLLAPVIDRLFFGPGRSNRALNLWLSRIVPAGLAVGVLAGAFFVHRDYPAAMSVYVLMVLLAGALWTLAGWLYANDRRASAFAFVNLGIAVPLAIAWPAAAGHINLTTEGRALARGLENHGVPKDALIYQVHGRPDSSIEFYSGYRVRRLINELEMAELRGSRSADPTPVLLAEFERRLREKLAEPAPVYLAIEAGWLTLLQRKTNIAVDKLFELHGFHLDGAGEDLVVITQPANTTLSHPVPTSAPTPGSS